ncbi:MAG: DoxX family protein [Planctomycetia bacterium]|nr:DoxX family protein [Planctomycetia bacterium]
MSKPQLISKFLYAIFLLGAGAMHFLRPEFYVKIMPPYLPWHLPLVYLSGVAEMGLGALLLVPGYTRLAAWGIIALMIAIFPANIYVYQHQEILPAPPYVHLWRLPLQAMFILWAFSLTRTPK